MKAHEAEELRASFRPRNDGINVKPPAPSKSAPSIHSVSSPRYNFQVQYNSTVCHVDGICRAEQLFALAAAHRTDEVRRV